MYPLRRKVCGKDARPFRHQVIEIPEVAAQVTEYGCIVCAAAAVASVGVQGFPAVL